MPFFVISLSLSQKDITSIIPLPIYMKRICILFFLLFSFTVLNSFPQGKQDTPRNGEGIHAFLRRHNREGNAYFRQFLDLNKGKLGKNNSLKRGVKYDLPPLKDTKESEQAKKQSSDTNTDKKRTNKLFGKKHKEYTILSDKLKGATFFLSSGHGGPDCGAVSHVNGRILHEDEYAYDITLRLARTLLEQGATVHIIIQDAKDGIRDEKYLANSDRETCMGTKIPRGQLERLKQRSDKINSLSKRAKGKYKRAAFIHLDSRENKQKQIDVYFYHAGSADGIRLTKTMQETFDSHYNKHQPNRGYSGTISARELYVLRNTSPVGIYAELGNIQNAFDQRRFLDPDNRQALANWMCRGFIKDYENWKKRNK